jgi:hypothetical protein
MLEQGFGGKEKIRVHRNEIFRKAGSGFADDEVPDHRVDGFSIGNELLEAHCGVVFQNGFDGLVKNLPVDFPPVPDNGDIDHTALIVDLIDHSVITDSKPPQVFCTANLLTALGTGSERERFDLLQHPRGYP